MEHGLFMRSYLGGWRGRRTYAVLCVGYNDDDPNNSYWIMLNSWGTDRRPSQRPFPPGHGHRL